MLAIFRCVICNAVSVALLLILLVKRVMFWLKHQWQQANLQRSVLLDGAALAAIGGKPIHRHPQGQTALAVRASGTIDAQAAAPVLPPRAADTVR